MESSLDWLMVAKLYDGHREELFQICATFPNLGHCPRMPLAIEAYDDRREEDEQMKRAASAVTRAQQHKTCLGPATSSGCV